MMLHTRRVSPSRSPLFSILAVLLVISGLFSPPPAGAVARAAALATPVPLTPAENTDTTIANYPPLGIPEFTWEPVEGATQYRLQVSHDTAFTSSPVDITTANTRYTPLTAGAALFYDGDWYWHVRVEKPVVGDYTSPMHFYKKWATDDNAPLLIAPLPDAWLGTFDSGFTWQPVTGAARYKFQIAENPTSFDTSPTYSQITLATTHQPALKLDNGDYFWRVVPLDAGDNLGLPSEIRHFSMGYGLVTQHPEQIPALLEPADGSNPTFTPTFRWTAVPGTQYYDLQYTSDPACSFGPGTFTSTPTRAALYTPTEAFANDVNYCWRVRAHSGISISDYSPIWSFTKKWYIQPELLTPTNNYQYVRYPFLSWTPVPGAARYRIEVNPTNSFPPSPPGWTDYSANPFYIGTDKALGGIWYWRITPIDGSDHNGLPSQVYSFNGIQTTPATSPAPQLASPLYYYTPRPEVNPREDRSVAYPIFQWQRDLKGTNLTEVAAYRIQVDDDDTFQSVDWTVDTENLSASPTSDHPFSPAPGSVYYWRVCPLDALGGSCLPPPQGMPPYWSQVWKVRFDSSKALPATAGPAPALLRPAAASEAVETAPLLEWRPLQGASSYVIEISTDPAFAAGFTVDQAETAVPAHTPRQHLNYYPQQAGLDLPYGTYYWRVRSAGQAAWSPTWRFQIAAQSHWKYTRASGDPANDLPVAADTVDGLPAGYELTDLDVAQSSDSWFFGFHAGAFGPARTYGLYLDLDHKDGSGATSDPRNGNLISVLPAHLPEYAIYVLEGSAPFSFSASQVAVYHWSNGLWGSPQWLVNIGGGVSINGNYLELRIPSTAIGMEETTGSAAISLFSVDENSKQIQDSVPASGPAQLDRFASVSEKLMLAAPPSNATGDPTTLPSVLPFFWSFSAATEWEAYDFQAALDVSFTSPVYTLQVKSTDNIASLAAPVYTAGVDFTGDNTYYWRVRPKYHTPFANIDPGGAWSEPGRFERQGFIPQNLTVSDSIPTGLAPETLPVVVTNSTPTFSWDRVEGAKSYEIQADQDPNFGSPDISAVTAQPTYTPVKTLSEGLYYWRVRLYRTGTTQDIKNHWSAAQQFTLSLPRPGGLTPDDPHSLAPVKTAPTLCWTPVMIQVNGEPVQAAWKYRVQVSKDANFSTIFDSVDGTEQHCWTPAKGYDDGAYYWHVAAMFDSGSYSPILGSYSATAVFKKQYPTPTLLSPLGSSGNGTPTFIWSAVDGAAKYRLEISLFPTFSPLYEASVTTVNTRYTPLKQYTSDKRYYWHVAIIDRDGKLGPFNDAVLILGNVPQFVYLPLLKR